jgi:hypothetical protein
MKYLKARWFFASCVGAVAGSGLNYWYKPVTGSSFWWFLVLFGIATALIASQLGMNERK